MNCDFWCWFLRPFAEIAAGLAFVGVLLAIGGVALLCIALSAWLKAKWQRWFK